MLLPTIEQQTVPEFSREQIQRLKLVLAKTKRDPETGCWIYRKDASRYHAITLWLVPEQLHRIMYKLFYGPIPLGHIVHHICYKKGCYNPEHLVAITLSENTLDSMEHYRLIRRGTAI